MKTKLKMVYWKGEKFWVGKLVDHPDIMTQGETVEELEENIADAYRLMMLDDVPIEHKVKEIELAVRKDRNLSRSSRLPDVYLSDREESTTYI